MNLLRNYSLENLEIESSNSCVCTDYNYRIIQSAESVRVMSIVTEMKQIAYYYRKETDCSDAVVAHLGGSCDH